MDFQTNKGIYKITCLTTGKFYIGSSNDLRRRRYSHFYELRYNKHKNKYLQSAFNKYGKEDFVFEVLKFVGMDTSKTDILLLEQKYIDSSNACDNSVGFNVSKFVGKPADRTGFKHSKETLELYSKQRKGKNKSAEFKQLLSEMYKGKSMKERTEDPEWSNNKKGKSMKEIIGDPNWIDPRIGRNHAPEAIQKMSELKRGEKNPVYGKTWKKSEERILAQTGSNNHMFGKSGNAHHGFNSELITLIKKQGETLSQPRFYWRSIKVDINAIINGDQISSKGWRLLD